MTSQNDLNNIHKNTVSNIHLVLAPFVDLGIHPYWYCTGEIATFLWSNKPA